MNQHSHQEESQTQCPNKKRRMQGSSSLSAESLSTNSPPMAQQSVAAPTSQISGTQQSTPAIQPDALVSPSAAIQYWSSVPTTDEGVLGGYPQVSRIDLRGSANFLAKLRLQHQRRSHPPSSSSSASSLPKLGRAADCGAGIGRVTTGFLTHVATTIDIVEPVRALTEGGGLLPNTGSIGNVWNVGLEDWYPSSPFGLKPSSSSPTSTAALLRYDLIWNQWCLGQLPDTEVIAYLRRLPAVLSPDAWIVVKENVAAPGGPDIFDETDSSVTRTEAKFRSLFEQAGMKVVLAETQRGFPKELYRVVMFGLRPSG